LENTKGVPGFVSISSTKRERNVEAGEEGGKRKEENKEITKNCNK
jgi:hypothetical protein